MKTINALSGWCSHAAIRSRLLAMTAMSVITVAAPVFANDPAEAYFETLRQLCGARFEGEMTFPAEGQDAFAGKLLVAEFKSCTPDEVRIPFAVGEDTSRTWIISRTADGLHLQHDHRHPDGTEDDVNMYGGLSDTGGSASSQSFKADAHTRQLIPEAATNVWTISLTDNGDGLVYALQRHEKPRFEAQLKRVATADPDPRH
ncbi:hypothetical protein [Dokdonella sp.]|uniref:hypothetical protein n=1 Tax=Dokdonella sp. TaxID=2291710 RepID=UPI003C4BB308